MGNKSLKNFHGMLVPIKLSDLGSGEALTRSLPKEIQLIRTGTYFHDKYGKIEITPDHLKKMVYNFNEKVRGIDIAVDYGHESEEEAAAWLQSVYTKNNDTELWAVPKFTKGGEEKVLSEEYRYISPDFTFEYTNNETLKNHGPVLLGAGLTNRPVIKGMAPLTLSEGYTMDELQKAKEKIALLEAEIAKLKAGNAGEMSEADKAKMAEEVKCKEDVEKKLSEALAENKKLKEAVIVADKNKAFDVMLSEGKACEAQRASYLSGDMEAFAKAFKPVNFDEKGHGGEGNDSKNDSFDKKIMKLAEAKMKDDKNLDYGKAISMVLSENKELNEEYKKQF